MATHSSILGWRTLWTEEPGGLQSIGSQSWIRLKRLSMGHGDTQVEASSGHQKFRTGLPQRFPMNT